MMRMNTKVNPNEAEIDLGKFFYYYLQHWFILLVTALAFAFVALFSTYFFVTPKYQASVTVYVNNTKSTQSMEAITGVNLTAAKQLVNTYVNIIKSETVLDEVIEEGKIEYDVEKIRSIMDAEQVDDTEMFTVTISDPDPKLAAHIVNTIAKVAPDRISGFVKGSSTEIIDYAKVPKAPYTPSYILNVAIGGVLGLLCAGIFLTLQYFFNIRIKDEDDVATYLNVPVLGTVPRFADSSKKSKQYEIKDFSKKGGR